MKSKNSKNDADADLPAIMLFYFSTKNLSKRILLLLFDENDQNCHSVVLFKYIYRSLNKLANIIVNLSNIFDKFCSLFVCIALKSS